MINLNAPLQISKIYFQLKMSADANENFVHKQTAGNQIERICKII